MTEPSVETVEADEHLTREFQLAISRWGIGLSLERLRACANAAVYIHKEKLAEARAEIESLRRQLHYKDVQLAGLDPL